MSDKRTPWMKFYGADWRANAQLRLCSLAARGLWIEMLCLAHEAEPYGHLLIAGKVPTVAQIAMQVAALPRDVEKLIAELEAADVFERSPLGAIVSRRMVRDRMKAERDAQNSKGGGNPRLKGGVNPPDNPTDNGGDKAQMPDARCQIPEAREESERVTAPRARGTRLPADWQSKPAEIDLAEQLLGSRAEITLAKFRDYWAAKAGAGGVKLDWDATWRNWIRREAEGSNGQQNHRTGTAPGRGKPAISPGWMAGALSAIETLEGGGVAD